MEKAKFAGSSMPSCLKCKFYDTVTDMVAGKTVTVCRLNPPAAFAMLGMTGPGQFSWMQYTGWPQVAASDWCGKHERSLDS